MKISHATYVACGLKCGKHEFAGEVIWSCHVCGMWIEIGNQELSGGAENVMPRMWHVD